MSKWGWPRTGGFLLLLGFQEGGGKWACMSCWKTFTCNTRYLPSTSTPKYLKLFVRDSKDQWGSFSVTLKNTTDKTTAFSLCSEWLHQCDTLCVSILNFFFFFWNHMQSFYYYFNFQAVFLFFFCKYFASTKEHCMLLKQFLKFCKNQFKWEKIW